jgi:dGTPase
MWTHRRSGQTHQRGNQDHRDPYERDRTRVIHCPAFRRLQRKTQILGTDEGDFHRTRLTHSLEVASIGRSIVRNLAINPQQSILLSSLLPNDDLISVICLLHDIGHPPFGHGGEVALNYMMRNHGGFEGNGQTLRLLTKIENSYGPYGLDLTRRALLGILKYPVNRAKVVATGLQSATSFQQTICINDWLPPKAYFDCEQAEVEWLLSPFSDLDKALFQSLMISPQENLHGKSAYHSFDCSIMDVADNIAYGVHDLEDAIHLGLINRNHLDNKVFGELLAATPLREQQEQLLDLLFSQELYQRKQAIGEMVNYFITATQITITHENFENSLLRHKIDLAPTATALLSYLMHCIYIHVIDSQEARTFEYGGQTVVQRLFEALSSNPASLLDNKNRALYLEAEDEKAAYRVICDYIANMTDEYAHRMHERLFGFNTRTIFERLG